MIGKFIWFVILIGVALAVWATLDTSYLDKPAASVTGWDQWGWEYSIGWRSFVSLILGFIGWAIVAVPEKKKR